VSQQKKFEKYDVTIVTVRGAWSDLSLDQQAF
jgi:hypothetical protein